MRRLDQTTFCHSGKWHLQTLLLNHSRLQSVVHFEFLQLGLLLTTEATPPPVHGSEPPPIIVCVIYQHFILVNLVQGLAVLSPRRLERVATSFVVGLVRYNLLWRQYPITLEAVCQMVTHDMNPTSELAYWGPIRLFYNHLHLGSHEPIRQVISYISLKYIYKSCAFLLASNRLQSRDWSKRAKLYNITSLCRPTLLFRNLVLVGLNSWELGCLC